MVGLCKALEQVGLQEIPSSLCTFSCPFVFRETSVGRYLVPEWLCSRVEHSIVILYLIDDAVLIGASYVLED